jgi:type IV pilus assembly protein PilM
MLSRGKNAAVVGLDIETGSVAATEVGSKERRPGRTGVMPLGAELTREGEVSDPAGLSEALGELFSANKLGKTVRVGVANQRIVVRTLRLPLVEDQEEIDTAVRFQAQDQIPMPLEHAVMDYEVIRRGPASDGAERTMDVIFVAARRDMIGALLEAVRGAGLKPIGIDLSAFGMIRALAGEAPDRAPTESADTDEPDTAPAPNGSTARLYCSLGDVTNLAVAQGRTCLFTRVSPFGLEGTAQRLAERRGLTLDHARRWLAHVGLERPVEEIEGDPETVAATRETLADGAAKLADELRMSLEFYGAQEGALPVESVVACGPGTAIEGLTARLHRQVGQPVSVLCPSALAGLDDPLAARLTVSYGLALEE